MPTLNISAPHQLPQNEALRRIKSYIDGVRTQFADKVRDLRESWNGNEGTFSGSGSGITATGNISVNPSNVVLELELPFAAMFFKGKIESTVRKQLARLLA